MGLVVDIACLLSALCSPHLKGTMACNKGSVFLNQRE